MDLIKLTPKDNFIKAAIDSFNSKKQILFRHGHIAITGYKLGDNWAFEKSLSIWNKPYYRYELKGAYYVPELKELRIPRGYPPELLQRAFPTYPMKLDNKCYPYTTEDYELYAKPIKDVQAVALAHMLSKPPYENMSKYTQQIVNMDTGDGKTYCGVGATVFLRGRAIIFSPMTKLVPQWQDSYNGFSSIKKKEVLIVQGSHMCEKIREGKYSDIKVFIMMTDTFTSYVKRYGNIKAMQMLAATNCYLKIIDEAHKDLNAVVMIECLSNFRMNYYMTASFGRANEYENTLIKRLFQNVPKFGQEFKTQHEKHLNMIVKKYYFTPTQDQIMRMYRKGIGLMQKPYESILINENPLDLSKDLKRILKWSKDNLKENNRLLILCSTLEGIAFVAEEASKIFGDEAIGVYHSKMKEHEKKENLEKRVIVGTEQGLGTGADIKLIQHVINIVTYSNKIGATQYPGRGRKIDDDTPIVYIEMVNFGYVKTISQFEKREPALKKKSRTGKILMLD